MRSLSASVTSAEPPRPVECARAEAPVGVGAPSVSRRSALELLRSALRRERQHARGSRLTLVVGELSGVMRSRGPIGNWAAGLAFERLGAALEANRRAID